MRIKPHRIRKLRIQRVLLRLRLLRLPRRIPKAHTDVILSVSRVEHRVLSKWIHPSDRPHTVRHDPARATDDAL
jgi:hypothetical protein